MKRLMIVLAFIVAASATLGLATGILFKGRQGPDWSVEGRRLTVDSCVIGCPCLLGEPPTNGVCKFVTIFHVDKGHYGRISLENTNFAEGSEFVRTTRDRSPTYSNVVYYIDSNAPADQRRALKAILSASEFAEYGATSVVREAPIQLWNLEALGKVGRTYGGTIGQIGRVEVTPIEGSHPGQPLRVQNAAGHEHATWIIVGKSSNSFYKDGDRNFWFDGTAGETMDFSYRKKR